MHSKHLWIKNSASPDIQQTHQLCSSTLKGKKCTVDPGVEENVLHGECVSHFERKLANSVSAHYVKQRQVNLI